ncbi:MAG: RidA family protein [Roseivirga sp.]|uniref:RidA family protein n=1 Tax=Roseivirga sp. TaxID=1964215 RepID=UPI001B054CB6|nr:Rid family detoxifying hydrolase [Roseivirga sp.]MBO6495893.1 RidA family protein [Roseivirga sp.]
MKKTISVLAIVFAILSCQTENQKTIVEHYQSEEMASLGLPFSDAVRVDNMLYLSGVVGMVPGKMELVEGGLEAEAKQVMENIKQVLEANGSSMENAVKFTVFIDDISLWGDFNKVYVDYFPEKKPARSALGVEGLALGAAIEVECIAVIPE